MSENGILVVDYDEEQTVVYIDSTKEYLKALGQYKLLTKEEEQDLAVKAHEGDMRARDSLVNSNLRLVASIAKRYARKGVEMDDLIQTGNEGLLRAVEKFDPSKGFRFSTYATWWIRQAIMRTLPEMLHSIHIPGYVIEQIDKMARLELEQEQATGEKLTVTELAHLMGVSEKRIVLYQTLRQKDKSMDAPIDEDGGSTVGATIYDPKALLPDDELENAMRREIVDKMIDKLEPREIVVIRYRYGFDDGEPKTLEETGKEFGLTRERVRQIEQSALKKLRTPNYNKSITQFGKGVIIN